MVYATAPEKNACSCICHCLWMCFVQVVGLACQFMRSPCAQVVTLPTSLYSLHSTMGSQMAIEDSQALREHQPTPPVTDSLGRACICAVRPSGEHGLFVLPSSAYRLLLDYLQFDRAFCHDAIPKFLPYGWVSLSFHQKQSNEQRAILPEYAMTTYGPRTRYAIARACVHRAIARK